ncbi:hypothetical protein [uncultured Chitinophaga sp.]|jgi:hypothetical protein|uniref:hypothetical protein n=1 Tax=uncultured Chitinophaga sp. TaxID=339340 RepID=UPI0026285923|nr:hypothetical protein [uncultured Chitinophaga sp.]
MHIEKILYRNQALTFSREYDAVFLSFPSELPVGSEEAITVYYEGVPQVPDFSIPMNGGVRWDKDEEGNPLDTGLGRQPVAALQRSFV